MAKIIFSEDSWLQRQQPWPRLIGFLATVFVAAYEQWSAEELAWNFWLAGLVLGLPYLAIYQVAQGDRESLLLYPLALLFFYLVFAAFLDTVSAFAAWDVTGADMPALFVGVPAAIAHAARRRWPFLITSGLAHLPDYVLDARTVDFTDLSKPLFGKDLLRMFFLVFLLVALTLVQAGVFALYAVLLVYFLPWASLRQISRAVRERLSVIVRQGLGLFVLFVALGGGGAGALHRVAAQSPDATITIDATRPGMVIRRDLWGTNLVQNAPAADTVENPTFVDASRQIGVSLIRWPGGNNADAYDWKRDEIIKPGRRVHNADRVDIARMIQFTRDIGAEPDITVNFGTMTAQDAADLVEFLNGPADSPWGAQRAAMGFPDPLNVRFFEIGNEENQPHMWYYSWTAENPLKYFFGGEEERRGFYDNASSQEYDPVGTKGDFFKANGGPNQTYTLRFPPVRDVRIFWAASQEDVGNHVFEEWVEVSDLNTQLPDAKVFTLDAEAGILRFGDGVHGAVPPAGSYFLVEYTTYGHEGFMDFARAMRAVPSSVPIQIGAAVLPFLNSDPITDTMHMQEIFAEMDFYVRHQYNASFPTHAYGSYNARRQIATERVAHLAETYDRVHQYLESIEVTRTLSIGVTEWNIFLNENYWHTNRTLEGGVIAAEWFIRLLNAGESVPVAYVNQFALHGGNLALIRTQGNYSIAPMGYVFQGFADWPGSRVISTTVTTPTALAYDMTVPFLVAAAALSPDGQTLRIAVVNNAETTELTATLQIAGFTPSSAQLWRLSADSYDADNEHNPTNVVLREEPAQVPLTTLTLPPDSVTFVELRAPSQGACVGDANGNGMGDVEDIEATASQVGCRAYLPLVAAQWHQPSPTPTPTPAPVAIVLADGPGGLELLSAPATLPLTVGHVGYLPVEVQNYHRPITVSAQTLIHTYVNDVTASQPGDSPPFAVGQVAAAQSELKLQTLRMRTHPLTLAFGVGDDVVSTTLTLQPAVQPHTPLFGLHSAPFRDGLPAPFIQVWGPDCGSCPTTEGDPPGSTRDIACAKQQISCLCHPIQKILDPVASAHTRHAAPQLQRYASQFLRSLGGWGQVQIEQGRYLWDGLDWTFNDLAPQERDYSPLFTGIIYGNFGWMTCPAYTNPDGSVGFYDPNNTYLLEQYGDYVRELTARYAPELLFIETGNEPAAEFYLCPCGVPGGPACDAGSGPNQPACLTGPDSPAFVAAYGDLLFTASDAAAAEMASANPEALLITGALEMVPTRDADLTLTSEYLLSQGLLNHGNVALGIHQYPYLYPPNWISPALNCSYYQSPGDPFWLPAGCETAPPFEDYTTPAGRPVAAHQAWQNFDERVDISGLLHDAEVLGVLDRFYLFDTELHAGFHDRYGGGTNPATTPAREAMAGLRIAAINAHQRALGSEFVFAPANPAAYNLMVKHLAGATPVYAWDAPLTDAGYSGLVYKLFTRGSEVPVLGTPEVPGTFGEDIIALWSNADGSPALTLTLSADPTSFKQVTLTRMADAHDSVAITTTNPSIPPTTISVQPLREFIFLSVISDRPGFGWLAGIATRDSS